MRYMTLIIILIAVSLFGCDVSDSTGEAETPTSGVGPSPTAPVVTEGPSPELQVHYIDVGHGDSILCDLGDIEVLIDGGPGSSSPADYLQDYVDGAIEVMIATHPHEDHIGGLKEVLETFKVLEIWQNGEESASKTYQYLMDAVEAEGAAVHIARLHDRITAGDLSFFVHHPAQLRSDTNNNSIVLSLKYGEVDFMFMGDAQQEAEGHMMMLSSVQLPDADILKVGKHGSREASSEIFLEIIRPDIAIYMCGEGNPYGYPDQEALDRLESAGATLYSTENDGTVIVRTDGDSYSIIRTGID